MRTPWEVHGSKVKDPIQRWSRQEVREKTCQKSDWYFLRGRAHTKQSRRERARETKDAHANGEIRHVQFNQGALLRIPALLRR